MVAIATPAERRRRRAVPSENLISNEPRVAPWPVRAVSIAVLKTPVKSSIIAFVLVSSAILISSEKRF